MSQGGSTVTPAQRGDLVVVQQHHRDSVQHGDPREYDTFTVGVVTSITRDGLVKMFKEAGHVDEPDRSGRPDRGRTLPTVGFVRVLVQSAAKIDVAGSLATAACRTWELTGSVRPYNTLDELRGALMPHYKTQPGWEPLHQAGDTHAAARPPRRGRRPRPQLRRPGAGPSPGYRGARPMDTDRNQKRAREHPADTAETTARARAVPPAPTNPPGPCRARSHLITTRQACERRASNPPALSGHRSRKTVPKEAGIYLRVSETRTLQADEDIARATAIAADTEG